MKYKKTIAVFILICTSIFADAQSISRSTVSSAGGYFSSAAGSLSWTIGQPAVSTLTAGTNMLTQGFQQPDAIRVTLNLNLFIQGFYRGSGTMAATVSSSLYPTLCDTVKIGLAGASVPYPILYQQNALLQTNGQATATFTGVKQGVQYYIVINHRNAIETWSATTISLGGGSAARSFTDLPTKAFGDNLVSMGDGNFAIYSGDVNQNDAIQFSDFTLLESSAMIFGSGYLTADLTGDGIVESADYSLIESNVAMAIALIRP
jgi:hypothetical protein